MANALIGYTGFVGCNINKQNYFEARYNTSNISDIKNKEFDLIVCAGITADKWWANKNPQTDLINIEKLLNILGTVKARQFVLISTIDVYPQSVIGNESTVIDTDKITPYGKNRFNAEQFIKKTFFNSLIIRLPGLFGNGLKKNFIFDLINNAPRIIAEEQYRNLLNNLNQIDKKLVMNSYYFLDGFHRIKNELSDLDYKRVNCLFSDSNFNSLSFTHCDSLFQFYNLENIWNDIKKALDNDIKLLDFATEPILARDLAREVFGLNFINKTVQDPVYYDMKSIYSDLYNDNKNGYLYDRREVLSNIKSFVSQING